MKQISTLLLASILVTITGFGQTYTVTSNKKYGGNYPTTCNNCIFNISSGATLTIDRNVTLQNPVFNGGKVVINNHQVTLKTAFGTGKSTFNNVTVIIDSNSRIEGEAPISINNSDFTFKRSSRLNSEKGLEISNSEVKFHGNSSLYATGGALNLKSQSIMIAGDGTLSSEAYIHVAGPLMAIYDNSVIAVANYNNSYTNWLPYYGAAANKWNTTFLNNYNCNGSNPNRCELGVVYGPVNLMPSGVSIGNNLPVVLSDFSVKLVNNKTELTWVTDQENNSARFEVERSLDGTAWTTITKMEAKGNSSVQSKYAFTDKTPAPGINYYRLKMVDMDNSFEYSPTKSVRTAFSANVRVYPNPANNFVHVSVPVSASVVRLMNTAGQILQERKSINGGTTVSFDITSYSAGTYMVQVMQQDGQSRNSVLLIAK